MDEKAGTLTVKLESGLIIQAQKQYGLEVGDACWASYDFTKGKVRHLFANEPTLELNQDTSEQAEYEGEHGDDNDVVEVPDDPDSGALQPCSDMWEFWVLDSGAL